MSSNIPGTAGPDGESVDGSAGVVVEPLGGGSADEGGDGDTACGGGGVQFMEEFGIHADGDGSRLARVGVGGGPAAGAHGGEVVGAELPGGGEVIASLGFRT